MLGLHESDPDVINLKSTFVKSKTPMMKQYPLRGF
jgi:hypothetical protein